MFKTEESLGQDQVQYALKNIIRDGVASQAMGILTGGAFLIAFSVKLGASNFVIGLLAAIGPLSQLLQLPSIFLVEKIRNRRLITVVSAGLQIAHLRSRHRAKAALSFRQGRPPTCHAR